MGFFYAAKDISKRLNSSQSYICIFICNVLNPWLNTHFLVYYLYCLHDSYCCVVNIITISLCFSLQSNYKIITLKDLTPTAEIKASSRQAMIASLTGTFYVVV